MEACAFVETQTRGKASHRCLLFGGDWLFPFCLLRQGLVWSIWVSNTTIYLLLLPLSAGITSAVPGLDSQCFYYFCVYVHLFVRTCIWWGGEWEGGRMCVSHRLTSGVFLSCFLRRSPIDPRAHRSQAFSWFIHRYRAVGLQMGHRTQLFPWVPGIRTQVLVLVGKPSAD